MVPELHLLRKVYIFVLENLGSARIFMPLEFWFSFVQKFHFLFSCFLFSWWKFCTLYNKHCSKTPLP